MASRDDAEPTAALRFGRYEVQCKDDGSPYELGRGGMGVTYKGFDPGLGRRPVVLKVVNALLLGHDPNARARFRREASVAALLHYPHIAAVFDIGEERGDDYYVMEFIAGEDLLTRLKRGGPLEVGVALQITRQVIQALGAAWEQSIVHRDIKPGNLMLADRSRHPQEGPLVKVVDFGLAKALKEAVEEAGADGAAQSLTATAQQIFSPSYASPEQIEDEPLDVRSDLYSLGVTLWQMLTGEPTFGNTSYQKTIVGHLSKPPPLEELRERGVPEGVIGFLGCLLEKSPAGRPASPEAALDLVDALLRGEPGPGRPPENILATQAEPMASTFVPLRARRAETGDILDDRYRLDAVLGERPAGRTFRASDLSRGDALVCVKTFDAGWLAAAPDDFLSRLRGEVERVQGAPHPNLADVVGFSAGAQGQDAFLVSEWLEGPTLLAVLRQRGALPAAEVLPLAREIAAAADHAALYGLAAVDFSPHQIFGQTPVKLDPLAVLPDAPPVSGEHTIVHARPMRTGDDPVRALASLIAELLSGAPLSPTAVTCPPLPGLNERGNETLRRALGAGSQPFLNAAELCEALALAAEDRSPVPRSKPALPPAVARTPPPPAVPVIDLPAPTAKPVRRSRLVPALLISLLVLGLAGGAAAFLWQQHKDQQRQADDRAAEKARLVAIAVAEEKERQAAEQRRAALAAEELVRQEAEAKRLADEKTAREKAQRDKETAARLAADRSVKEQQAREEQERKQLEQAGKAAQTAALQEVLRATPGDEVIAIREDMLYLGAQPQRKARLGEHFRVLECRADLSRVFVPAADARGEIAGIRLSIAATAVRVAPVDVGGLLRKAGQAAVAGQQAEAERLLGRAAKAAPEEPAVGAVRDAIKQLGAAQSNLRQVQAAIQAAQGEVLRLRRNAEITARPNPLGDDGSGRVRAALIIAQADKVEKEAADPKKARAAEGQVYASKEALNAIPLPSPPAPPPPAGL